MWNRVALVTGIITFAAIAHPLWAQKNEVSLLAGAVTARHRVVADIGEVLHSTSASPSFQATYARQVRDGGLSVYLEAPVVIAIRKVRLAGSTNTGPDIFFTPGIRVSHPLWGRFSLHGAAGLGVASFTPEYLAYVPYLVGTLSDPIGPVSVILSPIPVILAPGSVGVIGFAPGNRQNSLAFGFGGGATYRLTQHFSLRADLRDYVTKAGLGGASGKNHGSFHAGLVFRF